MSSRLPRQQPAASACGVNDGSMRATCTLRAVSRAVFAVSTTLKVAPILVPCWNPRRAEEEEMTKLTRRGKLFSTEHCRVTPCLQWRVGEVEGHRGAAPGGAEFNCIGQRSNSGCRVVTGHSTTRHAISPFL